MDTLRRQNRIAEFLPSTPMMIAIVLGLLVPLIGYGLLPLLGIGIFDRLFTVNRMITLFFLFVGSIGYYCYMGKLMQRPQLFIYFMIVAWPPVEYCNYYLLMSGINIHLRFLIFLMVGIPGIWYALQNGQEVLTRIPHYKYYLAFWACLMFYFFFYNSHAINSTGFVEDLISDTSIGGLQFFAYFYCLMGILIAAIAVLKSDNPKGFFDTLNKAILVATALESLLTIAGYPFGAFSMNIDGFHRAFGIFSHPNPFSHHMGLLLLYLLGLFCYYQGAERGRIPFWLLAGGIAINMVAFLLGLSKTAIGVFSACTLILFLFNLSSPEIRKTFFKSLLLLVVIIPVGLWVFQAVTDQSFFDLLQARLDQQESLNWRMEIWSDLIANINGVWILFGHGFTSASTWVYQLTFNDRHNAKPLILVHNGYISLMYDMGLFGMLLFVSAISLLVNAINGIMLCNVATHRALLATVVVMVLYFLVVCGFDEMVYMFDAPLLFWVLSTVLFCMSLRERAR